MNTKYHMHESQQKTNRLTRVTEYLDIDKTRILFKTFFKSQFKDCLLTWMFCNTTIANTRINQLHEKLLLLFHSGYDLAFDELLGKDHHLLSITKIFRLLQ